MTTHITKKCPAISESDRMRACLELHGITHARAAVERPPTTQAQTPTAEQPADTSNLPQGWSALETLAEASRQVDLNENNRSQSVQGGADPADLINSQHLGDRFELQEQFSLEQSPVNYENRAQQNSKGFVHTSGHVSN